LIDAKVTKFRSIDDSGTVEIEAVHLVGCCDDDHRAVRRRIVKTGPKRSRGAL
jgi:hypothetical protein